jgi:hypothetical protein
MEPESPSPYPQVPATCPYPEPTPSSSHDPPPNFLKIHLNIILPSTPWFIQWLLSLRFSPPTPCAHLYHPPYAPHALPISSVSILPPAQYWVRSTDHSRATTLLPLLAVRPVQSLSAYTLVHFTFFYIES